VDEIPAVAAVMNLLAAGDNHQAVRAGIQFWSALASPEAARRRA